MKRKMLLDLLADHADALNKSENLDGFDSNAWLSARHPSDVGQILLLLQLAQAIKQVLVPVSIPRHFRSDLWQRLLQTSSVTPAGRRPNHHMVLLGAAAIGVLLILGRRLKGEQGQNQSHPATTAV